MVSQTEQNFTVLILDDCSTDDSMQVIKEIIGDDERFILFQNEQNSGVGFTKKKLVDSVTTEICGFLDPDDFLEQNALEMMIKAHSENPEVGLVYSNFTFCDDRLTIIREHQAKQIEKLDELYYNFKGEISHFATIKKSFYDKTEGINPYFKIAEDKDWYMKMCEIAPVLHLNQSLYRYRVHNGGISTNKNAEKAFYWHFVALIKMSERRSIPVEDLFFEKFISKSKAESLIMAEKNKIEGLKNSRLLKLLHALGLFKTYKYL